MLKALSHVITLGPGKDCCSTVLNKEYIIRSFPTALTTRTRQPATTDFPPIWMNLLLFCCFPSCWKKWAYKRSGLIKSMGWKKSRESLNVFLVVCRPFFVSILGFRCAFPPYSDVLWRNEWCHAGFPQVYTFCSDLTLVQVASGHLKSGHRLSHGL